MRFDSNFCDNTGRWKTALRSVWRGVAAAESTVATTPWSPAAATQPTPSPPCLCQPLPPLHQRPPPSPPSTGAKASGPTPRGANVSRARCVWIWPPPRTSLLTPTRRGWCSAVTAPLCSDNDHGEINSY